MIVGWLSVATIFALRYWLGLSWIIAIPVGIVGSVIAFFVFLFVAGKLEDHNLRKRGLPMLDDRWPDDLNSN